MPFVLINQTYAYSRNQIKFRIGFTHFMTEATGHCFSANKPAVTPSHFNYLFVLSQLRMCSFNQTSLPHCLGHYSRYLSILDVDQKTLHCPTYSGSLINLLVEPRSHFKRGNTYFTFAQSVQSKLVTKAFLLTFSHGHHSLSRPQGSSGTECFLSELHSDDKKILSYLSELIKLHFMEVTPNVLLFNYTTTSIFKL